MEDIYYNLDEDGSGHINRFKANKFLKELRNTNNTGNVQIILTKLDPKQTGKFKKKELIKWVKQEKETKSTNGVFLLLQLYFFWSL